MSRELDELQQIARLATREALEAYEPVPEEWEKNLVLGTFFEGDDRIFSLYVAGERPSDAIVITEARINRHTRSVQVSVSHLQKKPAS